MKAVILINGTPPDRELCLREVRDADLIIAADGAYNYAREYGITPHILMGDMDSVQDPGEVKKAVPEFRLFPREKDEIDSQLAIDMAADRGSSEIILLGILGGRFDHEFGNVMLMLRAARKGIAIKALDKINEITVQTGDIIINGEEGQTVSLLPLGSDVCINSTEGLYYSVTNRIMTVDLPYGISNVMTSKTARVKVSSGYLLIVKIQN